MATNFVWYRTCSLGAKVSQDLLDRFSQSLYHMVGIDDTLRDVATATNLVAKMGQNYVHPCIHRSVNPKWNGISLPQWAR